MTLARHKQICLSATPYYHCISRCVRRAFLCGKDSYTKKNYESRRIWIEERLHDLSQIFAIDIAAYSVMSNHLHVVLRVNVKEANQLSSKQVIAKWHKLYGGTPLSKRAAKGETLLGLEKDILNESIATWRNRLKDISWFMRCLNEYIARRALECTVEVKKQSSSLLTNILGCSNDDWDEIYQKFEEKFKTLVGASKAYKKLYSMFGLKRRRGLTNCKRYFG